MDEAIFGCSSCGFELFTPISAMPNSLVGLYDDARFPGRCIVSAKNHSESFDEWDDETTLLFMRDIKAVSKAIKTVTGSDRVNFSILGNTVAHVHAHLIPRYPELEKNPGKSPWNDERPHSELTKDSKLKLIASIAQELQSKPF